MPAIHKNRAEIAALFERTIAQGRRLGLEAPAIAEAARRHLRAKFLSVPVAVSGANFGVAETGTICVVESEGNGRMCTTLPRVLITVMGIEKVLAEWRDLEVMLQLLPRSSTAERMNPYTSLWTGVREHDGPREFHLILLDAGRTRVLADEVGRQALRCIRCSACLNVCPVYSRTGGHAYESVYPGPIGAILTPQLAGLEAAPTLPWASSLCGACYEVCPVQIDIPTVLVHLRGRVVREVKGRWSPERLAMGAVAKVFATRARYERAQRLARAGRGPLEAPGRPAGGLDRDARPARRAEGVVPRVVGGPRGGRRGASGAGLARRGRRAARGVPRPRARAAGRAGGRMSAREDVLARVRAALGPGMAVPEIPRELPAGRRGRRRRGGPLLRARGGVPRHGAPGGRGGAGRGRSPTRAASAASGASRSPPGGARAGDGRRRARGRRAAAGAARSSTRSTAS